MKWVSGGASDNATEPASHLGGPALGLALHFDDQRDDRRLFI
jgi:hypothetical protein